MKILAVTRGKGGVGKSTLSLNIARQLSLGGKRVLLVDFDIHNKGTTNLVLPKIEETSRSVTEIIGASEGFSKELSSESIEHLHLIPLTADGGLFFLPAARPQEMMEWQNFLASTEDIVKFLKTALAAIAEKNCLDVVLIDCYGGIDSLTVAAAGIADDTIIVNEPDVITFGGTLTLYKYMIKKYERLAVKPRFHFVINRISTRHSFSFLNKEYQKNLVKLSIDKNILGYFPYDKLLLDTFGDYPFFSELLPNGLFTQKVRLLIATLWGTQGYENFVEMSEARRKKIFERTSETGFAEPEAILRAMVNLPFYLVVPLLLLLGLHFQIGRSLSYWTIAAVLYTAGAALLLLILTIGAFEPVQISRWLWREATYKRHKRNLKKEQPAPYRMTKAVIQLFVASIPALVGVAIIVSVSYGCFKVRQDIWNKDGRLEEISIWPGEITGLRREGHYAGLHLNGKATIKPGTDLTKADFSHADMSGVKFRSLTMRDVNFTNANLVETTFDNTDLSGAIFNAAMLSRNTFSSLSLSQASFNSSNLFNVYMTNVDLSGARFTNSYLRLHFQGSNIFARGASQADFSDGNLISVEGDPKLDILKKNGAKVVKTPEDEYKTAAQATPPRLNDMIEALVLQGTKASLVEAEAKLRELDGSLQKTPSSVTPTKVGMFYLLRLLHAEMANQPTQQPAQQWCAWIGEHQILGGWSWEIWDADMQNRPLPPALKKELSRIEDSAQNKKRPDPFCNVATGATGTSATAASK